MAVNEDKINKFSSAMFNLVSAIKSESERCCQICGALNEKELMIITFVGENEGVKMSDIADNLKAPLSTLTSIADKLVANKLLTRYNSDEDRRVVKVALTDKGFELYKLFLTRKKTIAKKVLSQFNEKELNALINHIDKLASSILAQK